MKIQRVIPMIVLVFALAGQSLLMGQTQNEKDVVIEKILTMVNNKAFRIDVNRALPDYGPLVNLSSSNSLEIRGDSVVSYLPFYGKATSLPYGGGMGLNFEGKMSDFSVEKNKKGALSVQFKTSSEDDYFRFRILLYPDKSALIFVQPTHRQSISYQGYLKSE